MFDFLDDINAALGGNGKASSGKRTIQQQDALFRAGKTRAHGPNAPHVREVNGHPGAVDVTGFKGDDAALTTALTRAGFPVSRVINESGKGNYQGTGAHRHVEFGGSQNPVKRVDVPASNVAQATVPSSSAATPAQTDAVFDPFGIVPKVGSQIKKVEAAGNAAADVLAQTAQAVQAAETQGIEDLRAATAKKDAILADEETATTEAATRLKPIFAKRAEIAKRQSELAEMSPLKVGLLGIFNRNYNPERLAQMDQAAEGEIQATVAEYQTNQQFHQTMLNVVTGQYAGKAAMQEAVVADKNSDFEFAGKGWNLLSQQLSDSMQGVAAGTQLTQAQIMLRGDALDKMDAGQVNSAIAEANRNGGKATINGVPLSLAELTQRGRQLEGQELAIRGQRLGIQSQELGLARQQESNLIAHMSPNEIQEAIKNGGTFKGMKLDQNELTQALTSSVNRSRILASEATESLDRNTSRGMIDAMNQGTMGLIARMQGVTGANVPPAMVQHVMGLKQASEVWQAKIAKAAPEAQDRLRAAMIADLQGRYMNADKMVDKIAQSMTRNPDAQIVLGGWMKGIRPTGEQAVKGIIALSQGGLPPGVKLSGPAATAMNAGKAAVERFYKELGGDKGIEGGKSIVEAALASKDKPTAAAMARKLQTAVESSVKSAWQNSNTGTIINSIPQMAKAANHPLGQISPDDFNASRAAGDARGMQLLADKLGMPLDQVKGIFGRGGSKQGGFDKATGGQKGSFKQNADLLGSLQNQSFLQALDQSPSGQNMLDKKIRPSSALADFMRGNSFQSMAGEWARRAGDQGLGESLADSVSGGAIGDVLNTYSLQLQRAQGDSVLAQQANVREQARLYQGNPYKRAGVILGAIPGLNQHDETVLLNAVKQAVGEQGAGGHMMDFIMGDSERSGKQLNGKIDSFITHGKFKDPGLEKLRKTAAAGWEQYSGSTDRALSRLFGE